MMTWTISLLNLPNAAYVLTCSLLPLVVAANPLGWH